MVRYWQIIGLVLLVALLTTVTVMAAPAIKGNSAGVESGPRIIKLFDGEVEVRERL